MHVKFYIRSTGSIPSSSSILKQLFNYNSTWLDPHFACVQNGLIYPNEKVILWLFERCFYRRHCHDLSHIQLVLSICIFNGQLVNRRSFDVFISVWYIFCPIWSGYESVRIINVLKITCKHCVKVHIERFNDIWWEIIWYLSKISFANQIRFGHTVSLSFFTVDQCWHLIKARQKLRYRSCVHTPNM